MSRRKCAAPWPHPVTGGLWNTPLTAETTRENQSPRRIANGSDLNTRANRLTAMLRTTTPTTAAAMYAGVKCPLSASSTSASTGRPSFVKMFQMPVTPT